MVDDDYRGELVVRLFNFEKEDSVGQHGDKIAQLNFANI